MNRLLMHTVLFVAMLVTPTAAQELVEVRLDATSTVDQPLVLIGDVASVHGETDALKARIEKLDLIKLKAAGDAGAVSKELVRIRILLSGIKESAFKVIGASRSQVTRTIQKTLEQKAVESIQQAVAKQRGTPPENIQVLLLYPLPASMREVAETHSVEIRSLIPLDLPLGRQRISLAAESGDAYRNIVPVYVEISQQRKVLVAKQDLPRGAELNDENSELVERVISSRLPGYSGKQLLGRKTRRFVQKGMPIFEDEVLGANPEDKVLVRSREEVDLIYRKGRLKVTTQARALESGKLGERIRVMNTVSRQERIGLVTGPGQVRVQ